MEPAAMLVALVVLSSILVPAPQPDEPWVATSPAAYQLLVNSGLNDYDAPYDYFQGIPCQVASGWHRFCIGSDQPWWMDTRVFAASSLGGGWVERIEDPTSQLILSTQPYDAGVWQQVTGLVPGKPYGFTAAMLTIYKSSALAAVDNTMIKQVGIDPTGGTDPTSANVVWSQADGRDKVWRVKLWTAAYARASTVTVFARVDSLYPSGGLPYLNLSFIDSATLAQTGTVSASAPAQSATASFPVSWNNAVAPPDGTIQGYDVQWLDEADGIWHNWFTWTPTTPTPTAATFTGSLGHAYRFRARVWTKYPNGAHLFSPYSAEGDTRTCVACPGKVTGRVLGNDGRPLSGVMVTVSGTAYAATSQAAGSYSLSVPSMADPVSIVALAERWTSPPPLYGVSLAPEESLPMTWTLSLPGDAVANGDFEAQLADWTAGSGAIPVGTQVHTGHGAALLDGQPGGASLSQWAAVSDAWEPALSFWYRPEAAGPGDAFQVLVTVTGTDQATGASSTSTEVLVPSLAAGSWQFFSWKPGPPDAWLTGTVAVEFRLVEDGQDPAAKVYLDEVRLAPTPGGPYKLFLPFAKRQF